MKTNKGSALIMVLLAVMVLSILGIAILELAFTEFKISTYYQNSTNATYAAESGIEKVIAELKNNVNSIQQGVNQIIRDNLNLPPQNRKSADLLLEDIKNYVSNRINGILNPLIGVEENLDQNGKFKIISISYNKDDFTVTVNAKGTYSKSEKVANVILKINLKNVSDLPLINSNVYTLDDLINYVIATKDVIEGRDYINLIYPILEGDTLSSGIAGNFNFLSWGRRVIQNKDTMVFPDLISNLPEYQDNKMVVTNGRYVLDKEKALDVIIARQGVEIRTHKNKTFEGIIFTDGDVYVDYTDIKGIIIAKGRVVLYNSSLSSPMKVSYIQSSVKDRALPLLRGYIVDPSKKEIDDTENSEPIQVLKWEVK